MNRVTLAFFAVCGLDVLNSLDLLSEMRRREICDWIYRFQIVSNDTARSCSGFQGSSTINILHSDPKSCGSEAYKWGHLAMTYTGISMLITLGDDLTRLNRKAIVEGVAAVQRTDGSFSASIEGNEHDMRFVYCAAAICYMLDDWGTVDKKLMAAYIQKSIVCCTIFTIFWKNFVTSYLIYFSYAGRDMIAVLVNIMIWNHMAVRHFVPLLRCIWANKLIFYPNRLVIDSCDGWSFDRYNTFIFHTRLWLWFWFKKKTFQIHCVGEWIQWPTEQTIRLVLFILDWGDAKNSGRVSIYQLSVQSRVWTFFVVFHNILFSFAFLLRIFFSFRWQVFDGNTRCDYGRLCQMARLHDRSIPYVFQSMWPKLYQRTRIRSDYAKPKHITACVWTPLWNSKELEK